jgi:hypothetical protein
MIPIFFLLFAKLPFDESRTLPVIEEIANSENILQKLFFIILLIVLAWLIYSFAKSQKPKPKLGYETEKIDFSATLKFIKNIEKIAEKTKNYREALHTLSELLRKFIKEKNGGKIHPEFMTAEELKLILENRVTGELLLEISQLQFQENPPTDEDFKEVFKKAIKNVEQKHFASLKKGVST